MYGFIGAFDYNGINSIELRTVNHDNALCVVDSVNEALFTLSRMTLNKFMGDKVFINNEEYIIVIEGVIYNYSELLDKYHCHSKEELVILLFQSLSIDKFADSFNGLFACVVYDKKKKGVYLITDHVTYRPLWYYCSGSTIFFSTDIDWLYKNIERNIGSLELDYDGAYSLLNYGYMLGDTTLVKGVKKLLPGKVISYCQQGFQIIDYFNFPKIDYKTSNVSTSEYDEILKIIDSKFSDAIKKIFAKDTEYGYSHMITLSGGLDTRLVCGMAHRLGYNLKCITMGESGCNDIRVASQICNDFKYQHVIYELNNGLYLNNVNIAIEGNGGTIMWPGYAHEYNMLRSVNLQGVGAIHSGQFGDLILAGFDYDDEHPVRHFGAQMYGVGIIDKFSPEFKERELNRYPTYFQFRWYNRSLNSAGNGGLATYRFTEYSSAFTEKEFVRYMLSVPHVLFKDYKLYHDYMRSYLPETCNYIWDHTECKPGTSKMICDVMKLKRKVKRKIFHKMNSMNPYDKWYKSNSELRDYLEALYSENIELVNGANELKEAIVFRYHSDSTLNKTLACELLQAIRMYRLIV